MAIGHSRQLGCTAARKIRAVLSDLHRTGMSKAHPFSVGHTEKRMRDYAYNSYKSNRHEGVLSTEIQKSVEDNIKRQI